MPLYLHPPRPPKTASYQVRGFHCGVVVDRSTRTAEKREAKKILRQWEKEIERGVYDDPRQKVVAAQQKDKYDILFGEAANAYIQAGRERKYLARLLMEEEGDVKHNCLRREFGDMRCGDLIQQHVFDRWALVFYPKVTGATRNREFYTPVIAVLRHVGIMDRIKRPKGAGGRQVTTAMYPEQAAALLKAADQVENEFGLFLRTLCYTGMRLSEALRIELRHVSLAAAQIQLPKTKNGRPRTVHLTPELVVALANHPRGLDRRPAEPLFRFRKDAALYEKMHRATAIAGLSFPKGEGAFHLFCHTWATWMGRYNNMGADQLVKTGRWSDLRSAARYNHVTQAEESRKADNLPKVG